MIFKLIPKFKSYIIIIDHNVLKEKNNLINTVILVSLINSL